MKKYIFISGLIGMIIIYIVVKVSSIQDQGVQTWPHLPSPIGQEPVIITSAGQAAESYILEQIVDQLHIKADFRPRALAEDINDYQTVILVTGFSFNGIYETGRTVQEERDRVRNILKVVAEKDLPLILVHLGGKGRLDPTTFSYIRMSASETDYLIGQRGSNYQGELRRLAGENNYPITLVKDVLDIKTPLNSVFR